MASTSDVTNSWVQRACFMLFLPMYLMTLLGNGLIVLMVSVSEILCSPMCFFLGYLSLGEICYSSTLVPTFIADLLPKIRTISFKGYLSQILFFHFFVAKILLLVVMTHDFYMANFRPLHYMNLMSHQTSYAGG